MSLVVSRFLSEAAMVAERRVVGRSLAVEQQDVASAAASGTVQSASELQGDKQWFASRAYDLGFELGRASAQPLETDAANFWKDVCSYLTQAQQLRAEVQNLTGSSHAQADELRQWIDQFDAKLTDLTARQDAFLKQVALRSGQ
jgi:hypothetical protein